MDQIDQTVGVFSHQLFFNFVAHFRQKINQHLQHIPCQIGLTGSLAERKLPVERRIRIKDKLSRFRRHQARCYVGARFIAQQQIMQLLFFYRFSQIVVHARAEQLLFLPGHRMCRNGNNRCLLLMRKLVNQFAGAYAVHIRHLNIHQNQIKLHLFRPIHRLMSAITKFYVLDFIFQ
ncbi:hypothetical protein NGUA15_03599 [Salmonella enterica]|nr:hypothetical protein NGUA15_03599 [Salmonella enterica]